ncbi:AAA family ATPase, partial [Candidatus Synechococcus spongiarum]
MKLARVEIENYRAIQKLDLPLHPGLTVLHGNNGLGKTSVLSAIATGLGGIQKILKDASSIEFDKSDPRGSGQVQVRLTTVDDIAWERCMDGPQKRHALGKLEKRDDLGKLKDVMNAIMNADWRETKPLDLPIVAFYDTDRAVFDLPQRRTGFKTEFSRYEALKGALSARTDFRNFFEWFYARENEELREQKEHLDFNHRLGDLETVRKAIEAMLPGISNPRIKQDPLRFVVSVQRDDEKPEELFIKQLSGGYQIMLALASDLARRMAQGNPHLEDPLQSEAVVLIDEIELHLHPSWQQRILDDLTRTFPNTRFIVSTHSPQVLTTVKPEHIVELEREQGCIVPRSVGAVPTYGAEAGDVLAAVMGVEERPPGNEFVKLLA